LSCIAVTVNKDALIHHLEGQIEVKTITQSACDGVDKETQFPW